MIRVVTFDCDGVMFDSREANRSFYNHIGQVFGRPDLNDEELSYVHMHTVDQSITYLFQDTSHLESALEYKMAADYSDFLPLMVMEPGLKKFLDYLRPKFRTAISTNRTTTMKRLLDVFGLATLFDMVVSASDVANPKPHPESLLKILDAFGCLSAEMLYIGDSEVDRKAAEAAGVPLVAFKNDSLQAAYHAESFEEVISIIEAES